MCDEIDCDCGGDCCDDNNCCDCCTPQTDGTGSSSEVDHDCLYYLCCAGCILCPLFYVGRIKSHDEPTTTHQPESAIPTSMGKNEDSTIAATTTTSDATTLSKNNALVPSTVTMDHDQLKILDQTDPIESTTPMNRH